jgi:hypothetical protein
MTDDEHLFHFASPHCQKLCALSALNLALLVHPLAGLNSQSGYRLVVA